MENKACSTQINFEIAKSLTYSCRKLSNRIELLISPKYFERLQCRYSLSGRFREDTELEKYLKLIKRNTYEDGYKSEIELLVFRVQKPKVINLNGKDYSSSPKLIVKYIRTGRMPAFEV